MGIKKIRRGFIENFCSEGNVGSGDKLEGGIKIQKMSIKKSLLFCDVAD